MTHRRSNRPRWWQSIARFVCVFVIVVISGIVLSTGLSGVRATTSSAESVGTVDPVTPNQQVGRDRYVAQCSTCHLAVPAAILPQETWRTLLIDTEHYGVRLEPLTSFDQQLIWNYLRTYSRTNWGSRIPAFRVADSVYFTALHPGVTFDLPVGLSTCVACHTQARDGNFRVWQE